MSKRFLRSCLTLCFFYVFLFAAQISYGQGYDLTASSGTFTPLAGGTAIDAIEADDQISTGHPIGFSFTYFGTAYTTLNVSSNGFITFNANESSSYNGNYISEGTLLKAIAPLWDDLGGSGGTASFLTTGTVGSRVLTVEWLNWRWDYTATVGISFQVKLYEGTNKIEFVYRQEAGALIGPDASIGIVGNTASAFYSLSNSSASPSLDINGFDAIDAKPANGQTYTFTPNATQPQAPTQAASAITASPLGAQTATFSWANGNGAYRAVFIKQTSSTTDFLIPVNGVRYQASSEFGDSYAASNWYCIYNGSGNSVAVTNLQSTLSYRVQVVEYNGQAGQQTYSTVQVANNFTTLLAAPIDPVSTLEAYHLSSSQITVHLYKGNGVSRAVFVKAATTGTAPIVNNTTYLANANFGQGSQIGSSGWYCVFNGTDFTNLTITGLAANTAYRIHTVDYNGAAGNEKYYVSTVSGNPFQISTMVSSPPALPNYIFAATSGTFTPLAGGTAVDAIESDETLSGSIPIGFAFKMGDLQFTQLKASPNGFLTFSPYTATVTPSFASNDLEGLDRPLIAPLWDDLSGSGGQASYSTTGVTPNQIFTFEYLNWKWNYGASAAGISFQVKLYEANNKIEFIYRPEAGGLSSANASVGLSLPDFSVNQLPSFFSLNSLGAAPTVSTTVETTSISAKPASGQTYSFTPTKGNQTITFAALVSKTIGDVPFNLTATASSGLAVTYTSSNTAVATVSGSTVTILSAGTTDITALQAGNVSFNAATNVIQPLVVKATQTITFGTLAAKTVGDANFNLTATANSGLAVTYTSSNTAVATVAGSTITIVSPGTTDITASQAGNASYAAAPNVIQQLVVGKGNQTITFGALAAKSVGDANFNLTATVNSGLAVTYTSSNTAVATVAGSTVTIVGLGTTDITASQAGNTNYTAAANVIQPLVVSKRNQTITFVTIPTKTIGDAPFALSASSTSLLTVAFTTTSDKVTLAAGQVTIVKAGSVTIKADQAGNTTYNAATAVERTFCINPAKPVVTLSGSDTEALVLTSSNTTGNQWLKEGVAISGSTGATFSPTTPGIYTVITTVDNCASVASEAQAIIITGMEDISKLITISPNPVQNEVNIDLNSLGKNVSADVAIFDLTGRVFHSSTGKGTMTVNIASYDKGNYLVRVKAGSRIVTKQITKN